MHLLGVMLLAQLAAPARHALPVLAFPEPGLDDSVAYQGYGTRFFRDAAGNTVQIYLDRREGRVVHLLADADDESIGLTARDAAGAPVALLWDDAGASVSATGRTRTLEHRLVAASPRVTLGHVLLGSMRVERDYQYEKRHRAPYTSPPFALPEVERMLGALARLQPEERQRHLALLGASDLATLRARLQPTVTVARTASTWSARFTQPSLDGRDTLWLEVRTDPRRATASYAGDSIALAARSGDRVPLVLRIATTARPLTPLARTEIFNRSFLAFLDRTKRAAARRGAPDSTVLRARWLERNARGLELLASHEKLMAGLPNYATYFGRDMLLSALMMRPIWRDEMSEFVIAAALRKLGPNGDVSHEEAMGGQAVREAAAEYAVLEDARLSADREGRRSTADSLAARAESVLRELRRTRENYHMIDAEFQLAVIAGRWLGDPNVPAARKRAFLLDSTDGEPRVRRLLRELALVSRWTSAYAHDPSASNLVSFPRRDSVHWASASWRDSNAGYAGGRYAMDVNAIWAPHALESMEHALAAIRALGIAPDSVVRGDASIAGSPLVEYARAPATLRAAIDTWRGAARHFVVSLSPAELRARVAARLAAMPDAERAAWTRALQRTGADHDSLTFLALALDAEGRPIGVANSDAATQLFLGDAEGAGAPRDVDLGRAVRDARLFARAYPVGLLIDGVGPVVANDAYAPDSVWHAFERDPYHGPRVVWGREVNLFLLGVARRIGDAGSAGGAPARELRRALDDVRRAVEASGFRSELWSYEVRNGRAVPVRYGTGSDVQLWSTTDLAVQFALSRLLR